MVPNPIEYPKLALPTNKERLFVNKPIGNYVPYSQVILDTVHSPHLLISPSPSTGRDNEDVQPWPKRAHQEEISLSTAEPQRDARNHDEVARRLTSEDLCRSCLYRLRTSLRQIYCEEVIYCEEWSPNINFLPTHCKESVIMNRSRLSNHQIISFSQADCEELKNSYTVVQIIPPGLVVGFDVVLMSTGLGSFRSNVKYVINEQHAFEF